MAKVFMEFIADISQATKEVANLSKKTRSELDALSDKFKTFGSFASGAFAAIGVGFSLKKAIDEAAAFEVEVNRLTVALNLSGIKSEVATEQFLDYASSLQKTTTFTDDAVLSTASLIQNIAKLPTDQLKRATKASLDLASALRIDLNTASLLVAKAAEGNISSLSRYGIAVQKGKTNTETFANVLTALESKFGGSSEKAVNTYTGALTQLQNAVSDIVKEFGLLIIQNPELITLIKQTTESIQALEGTGQKLINIFSGISKAAVFLGKVISLPFSSLPDDISKPFERQIDTFEELNKVAKDYRKNLDLINENKSAVAFKKLEEQRVLLAKQAEEQFNKTKSSFESLDSKFKTFNLDPVKQEINQTNKNLSDLEKARRAGLVSDVNYQDLRLKIQQDGDKRLLKLSEETNKKRSGIIQGVVSGIGQGAAGVAGVASGLLSNLGPYGAAAGAALQFLSQGPEAVKAQLQGFIDGIPQIIDAVAAAIPVVVEVLAANSGKITTALSLQMPIVANKLAIELTKQSPKIAIATINSFVSEAGRFISALIDGIKGAFSGIINSGGGAGGIAKTVFTGGLNKVFKFADGGIVPGSAPFSDRIPALLTPGEYVLSRDDVKNLVTNSEKQAAPSRTTEMVTINLQIGQEKLASVIYDLSKRGFRLA